MRYACFASLATLLGATSIPGVFAERLCGQERPTVVEATIAPRDADESAKKKPDEGWRPLLPKTGLEGWKVTDFGSEGKVTREGELLIVEMGDPLNGITYTKKDFPKDNFEIRLEAKRVEGNDFLCGLTFPVGAKGKGKDKEEYCSLIAGGWGGSIVGLSSVDGVDASENNTTTYEDFKNGEWYKFRVRVAPALITAWINDQKLFDQERDGHEFSTRIEVWGSQPLGFCSFNSTVHVRNFEWRPLPQSDAKPQKK